MLGNRRLPLLPRRMDERGVALPMALFGLVAISILVTTAILTSSTDSAIAGAQTLAAGEMYEAEGALQAYVAERGSELGVTTTSYTVPGTQTQYSINVARMSLEQLTTDEGFATYSLRGEPSSGGRSLVAMLRIPVRYMNVQVKAGASFGTDAKISGSIDVNSSSELCNLAGADDAITHAAGTTLEISGQAATNIGADTSTFAGDKYAMRDAILNGVDLEDLAKNADIKFRQASSNPDSVFSSRPNGAHTVQNYRWGCPTGLGVDCTGADTTAYPLVVIDAMNADGTLGTVKIEGDHGQGMLVVLNGHLNIRGNFVYKGIILVEGSTDIHGGGSGGAKIEGGVVGLGTVNICNVETTDCSSGATTDDSDLSSGAVIQYNRCAINSVQEYINRQPIQQALTRPTFAWFEIVR